MSRLIKSLTYQIQQVFDSKLAIRDSKHEDKKNGTTADKIYSWDTYRSYMKYCNYFADYCKEKHNCRTLEECRPYVNEWLETRFNLSAYTVKLEAASLAKLYGCSTTEFVKTPQRNRDNITRSRGVAKRNKYFSEKNNQDLVDLCRALGPRRHELAKMKGTDLIEKDGKYFVGIFGKGGKYREAPIIGPNTEKVVQLFKEMCTERHLTYTRVDWAKRGSKNACYIPIPTFSVENQKWQNEVPTGYKAMVKSAIFSVDYQL